MTLRINWWSAGYQAYLNDDPGSAPNSSFRAAHIDWNKGWEAAAREHQTPAYLDRDADGLDDYFSYYP